MRQFLIFIIFFISGITCSYSQFSGRVFGTLKDNNGAVVKEAVIIVEGMNTSFMTNKKGVFEILNFPTDKKVRISFTEESHVNKIVEVFLEKGDSKELKIIIIERELKEVVVKYNQDTEEDEQVSLIKIDPRQTENLPSVFGDFNKILATLPGVSSNNELSSTYSVRGGNYNENLVYVNGMPIYRPFIVSTGQQEGLSFINPNMVSDVSFSAGGWQPKYGDKLSSVLAVEYKTPSKFAGSVTASALGGGFHLEGADSNHRFSFVGGLRYKDSRWVLRNTDVGAEFKPWFIDYQSYLNYDLTNREKYPNDVRTTIGLLTSYAKNSYYIEPQTKETNFGTFNTAKRFLIAFDGDETMSYNSYQNGLIFNHKFNSKLNADLIISSLNTVEREFFDVEAGMKLCEVSLDPSSDGFNKCSFTQDVGSEYRNGRNQLSAEIYNLRSNWEYAISDKSVVEWGVNYSNERFDDVIDEYSFLDSADYVQDLQSFNTELNLESSRAGGFVQHKIRLDSNITFTYGVRSSFWDVNKEVTISPRTQFSIKPKWRRNIIFKAAAGIYHQPPFYRELRNDAGVLNRNLKAQMATHLIAGMDYNFKMWSRDFKLTSEVYHKNISNAIVYDIDDVKIRYKGHNDAKAYATQRPERLASDLAT